MEKPVPIRKRITPFQTIIIGFFGVILLGAVLLMLPISSKSGSPTPFLTSLFTATSAVCVTGLVVCDTASSWSAFGQTVLLILIQIGGLGVVTVAAVFAILSGRRISLMQRSLIQESLSAPHVGGIVQLTAFIVKGTLLLEFLGALSMMPAFCRDHGLRGIWLACFHSVSAFCNAGFDILGTPEQPYVSLTRYESVFSVNLVVMLLIVIGGIGFVTWSDAYHHRHHLSRYRMQSKVILVTTLSLILVPAAWFFFRDFSALPIKERLLASFFQSVTPRTAGFNTADLPSMTEGSHAVLIALMLIGGSPGSTAGGIKTTTIAVLFANAFATFGRRRDPRFFGRRIGPEAVGEAATIFMLYLTLFLAGGFALHIAERLPLGTCLFEAASAIGTVGLTLGITPQLGSFSRIVLIMLMFFGRVGGLTLIYAAVTPGHRPISRLPLENIHVG